MEKNKILLIEPSKKQTDQRYSINLLNRSYYYPHLGLLSIQATLEKTGYEVEYFSINASNEGTGELTKLLSDNSYDFIGISTTTYTIQSDIDITLLVRKIQPDALIILGGYFAWTFPELILRHTEADVVIRGHGEVPLSQIAKHHLTHHLTEDSRNKITDIPGISFKYLDSSGTEQYKISEPYLLDEEQLNKLPLPCYSREHWRKYWNSLN